MCKEKIGLLKLYVVYEGCVNCFNEVESPVTVLWVGCAPMGHTRFEMVRSTKRGVYPCLKRPSFYCLIHFYKRCVSSLTLMGRSPRACSG